MPDPNTPSTDPLAPPLPLLAKLASAFILVSEDSGQGAYLMNAAVVSGLVHDPEVQDWLAAMTALSLAPVRR